MKRNPRINLLLPAAVLLVAALLAVLRWNELPVGAVTDDALYVELSRSLVQGQGHTLNVGPGLDHLDMDLFPPGMALLLAPLSALFPASLSALKLVSLLAGALVLGLTWCWVPGRQSRALALAVLALTAWNPWFVGWSTRVLSDIPYTALALAALLITARSLEKEEGQWRGLLLAGCLAGAAIAVRSVGWTVVLTVIAVLIWPGVRPAAGAGKGRGRPLVAFGVGVLLVLIPLWLLTEARPLGKGYAEQLVSPEGTSLGGALLGNAAGYGQEWPSLLLPVFGATFKGLFERYLNSGFYLILVTGVAASLLGVVWGAGRILREAPETGLRLRLALVYILITQAVLLNFQGYPSGVQTRLLLPLLPLAVWLVVSGVWSHPRWRVFLLGAMFLSALALNGWRVARPLGSTVAGDGSGYIDPGAGRAWVLANTDPDEVIMTRDPIQRHIHWNRPATDYPAHLDSLDRALAGKGVDLVLVAPAFGGQPRRLDEVGRSYLEALRERPAAFTLVHADSLQALYFFRTRRP